MRPDDLPVIAAVAFVVVALIFGYFYSLRYVFQYSVTETHLRIRLFGLLPVRNIRLDSIVDARIIRAWADTQPFSTEFRFPYLIAERWPSYVFQKRGIFIQKQTGLIRYLILSPKNPEEFLNRIRHSEVVR
jgi:hypothetical protein